MGYYDYLPPWQVEMVKNHWDLNKRISFMNKCQVDLWVDESKFCSINFNNLFYEYDHDYIRMNGWLPDELMSAKKHLEDEYEKVADRIELKKQQQGAPKAKLVDTTGSHTIVRF